MNHRMSLLIAVLIGVLGVVPGGAAREGDELRRADIEAAMQSWIGLEETIVEVVDEAEIREPFHRRYYYVYISADPKGRGGRLFRAWRHGPDVAVEAQDGWVQCARCIEPWRARRSLELPIALAMEIANRVAPHVSDDEFVSALWPCAEIEARTGPEPWWEVHPESDDDCWRVKTNNATYTYGHWFLVTRSDDSLSVRRTSEWMH